MLRRYLQRMGCERRIQRCLLGLGAALFLSVASVDTGVASPSEVLDKANTYFANGDYSNALRYYTLVSREIPNEPKVHYNVGLTQYRMRRHDDALVSFSKAIDLDKTNGLYLNGRGSVYLAKHNLSAALADFDKAVALDSGNRVFLQNQELAWATLQDEWRSLVQTGVEQMRRCIFPLLVCLFAPRHYRRQSTCQCASAS